MATNYIMIDANLALFFPPFTNALTVPLPGVLIASSQRVRVNKTPLCLAQDFHSVIVEGVVYISPPFVVPGEGEITIFQIAEDQYTKKVRCNGKPILLKGTIFQAKFTVQAKAKTPPPPSEQDPMPEYMGQGIFVNTNVTVRAK